MEERSRNRDHKYITILVGVLTLFGLYLASLYGYLLFHSLAEMFSIVVACGIFIVAWNSSRFSDNGYFLFIGIAYLFVGGLDGIHTLAYTGMGVFPGYGTNLATQLWIAARYLESLSLLLAPFFFGRKLRQEFVFLGYAVVVSFLLASIFYWRIFPVCFVEGHDSWFVNLLRAAVYSAPVGLTPFKKISEYIISLILLASIPLVLRKRRNFDAGVLRLLIASIVITVGSEMSFTFYIHAYGFSNMIGHFLKIISFYLIYRALIRTTLVKPYDLLFRDLKQSNEFLNSVLESLNNPLYVVNAHDYTVEMANSAARLENPSEGITCYALTHKSDVPCGTAEHPCPVEEIKRRREPVTVEHIHYDIEGNPRNVEVHGYPTFDDEGNIIQIIEYCLDVTERKQAEERERHRVLSMRSDRLRSLGEMAAGIAHELNQPLQGVRGMAERLLISIDRGWELTEEKIRDRAGTIVEQADRMEHIIEHVRVFAREAGKPELRPVQVNDVVRAAMDMLGTQFRSHGIQLEHALTESMPTVSANPFSLEEVIINLLINARDAVEEQMRSGSLSTPPRVFLRTLLDQTDEEKSGVLELAPAYVKIEVTDSGIGIPESVIEKVFDPFFTTKDPDRGTGLGLSISKSIVEEFYGTIHIQSTPGSGTTVTISLPVEHHTQDKKT